VHEFEPDLQPMIRASSTCVPGITGVCRIRGARSRTPVKHTGVCVSVHVLIVHTHAAAYNASACTPPCERNMFCMQGRCVMRTTLAKATFDGRCDELAESHPNAVGRPEQPVVTMCRTHADCYAPYMREARGWGCCRSGHVRWT
jgi:hypothetical protein